jgi:Rab3 GTPase-activating protein catalytic subunit
MSAFKAANPAAVFEDFIAWYGNPEDPLNQYEEAKLSAETTSSLHDLVSPTKTPEDEAFEALFTLSATRTFWFDCWDEGKSISAEDQEPLFDAFSSVEMLLLWFESMHPAILINQALAINITMANFILQASAPSLNLRAVKDALMRLESKTTSALQLLNKDVIKSISNPITSPFSGEFIDPFAYISPETIKMCESVVTLIGSVEILISRATSLLTKLNGDEEMVQMILEAPEGRNIEAQSCQSRSGIMEEIHTQQKRNGGIASDGMNDLPFPSVREYVLRNLDEQNPCQLTTCIGGTFGLESGGANSTKGGLVLAMKKCLK